MAFDPKKFFSPGGGTKVITDSSEQKKVFQEIIKSGGTTYTSGGGSSGGGGGSSGGGGSPTPPPIITTTGGSTPETRKTADIQELKGLGTGAKALVAREQLRREAAVSGTAFSMLGTQRFLSERGTSVSDLRAATRGGQQQFRETGVNVFSQVRDLPLARDVIGVAPPITSGSDFSLTGNGKTTQWEVQPAPSQMNIFKDYTSRKGYITGTLDYAKDWFTSTHDYFQQSAGYYGGLDVTELSGSALRMAPYFAPGGAYIMMGEAFEGLTSQEGKEIVSARKESWIDRGVSPGVATGLSIAPEVGMFSLGFVSSPLFTKTKDWIGTLGRQEIKTGDLVRQDILTGKATFPTAPPQTHLKEFKTSGKGYHSTSQIWDDLLTTKGSSELPGTYISTEVSPHFLKTGGGSGYKFDVLDYFYGDVIYGNIKPGVMEITPEGFRPGKWTKTGKTYSWVDDIKYGIVDVPAMKTEIEGIIRPGTQLIPTGKGGYIKYGGRKIPVDTFKLSTSGSGINNLVGKPLGSYGGSYGGVGTSSYGGGAYSLIGSGVSSALGSYKPSSFVSGVSSYKPTFKITSPIVSRGGGSPFSYKPSSFSFTSPVSTSRISPINIMGSTYLPTKKKTPHIFAFDLGFKSSSKSIIPQRKFMRTPSLGSVLKFQLNLPQLKFSKAQERSGLFERAYTSPKIIKSLGPFKI